MDDIKMGEHQSRNDLDIATENHEEALQLAHLKKHESNLARCYIQLQADKEYLKGKWNECRIVNSYIVEQSTKLYAEDFFPWIMDYDLKPGEVQYEEAKTNGTWEKHQDSTQEE